MPRDAGEHYLFNDHLITTKVVVRIAADFGIEVIGPPPTPLD
ncbi:MAG: hypothetical protein AAF531_08620 [Actinomycetota bacterium]